MNRVWEILNRPETIVVFDIDGTLFSYNYGTYKAHHDLDAPDTEEEFQKTDMYRDAKGLPLIREFINAHGPDKCYCLSMEPHGHEEQKSERIREYYGIRKDHCIYVNDSSQKCRRLTELISGIGCPTDSIVYVDDNELVLRDIEDNTKIITAHVTLFFEER